MKYVTFDEFGDPGVLHVADGPAPVPAEGEVLIRVEAAGVSHADVMQRRGQYPPPPGASPVLGLELAGTVAALGPGTQGWSVGDRVCALCTGGGYAELATVPQEQVLPLPQHWTAVEAASLPENAFTVYDNLFTRGRLGAGESLLVHGGTSGIGSTAIMFARAFGASVLATAGSPEKCAACVRIGADEAIDYRTADFVAEVARITHGRGVDVVLDLVGGDYIARDLQALAADGRVVCLATQRGREASIDLGVMLAKRAAVMASSLRARTVAQKAAIAARLLERVWPLLPAREPIFPVIDAVYPFERASEAHARLEASAHVGKIVLVP